MFVMAPIEIYDFWFHTGIPYVLTSQKILDFIKKFDWNFIFER